MKVVTINLLSDLSRWPARRELLAQELLELEPDLVACQEVKLPENNAGWLVERLNTEQGYRAPFRLYLTPLAGKSGRGEALAILSRRPIEESSWLDLGSQDRVAQAVRVRIEDSRLASRSLVIANGHFYWHTGESAARDRQVDRLLDWLRSAWAGYPAVVCGDFNAEPQTSSIRKMRANFISAYSLVHGREPEYTYPTKLPTDKMLMLGTLIRFVGNIRLTDLRPNMRRTFDYIFVDPGLPVSDCRIVLNRPAPLDPRLYPSDHFGLMADIGATSDG